VAGEEEQKKLEGIGFAGLSSLVSDVDTTPPPAPKAEPTTAAPRAERPASQSAQPQPQPSQRQTYQEPAQPSSGSSGGKWVLGIAAVVGVFWLISLFNKDMAPRTPTYTPSTQTRNSDAASAPSETTQLVAPKFNDYLSDIYEGPRAKVNLLTDFDRNFKTRIRNTQSQLVNFSGDHVLSTWGCGTSCLMGVAVNARTGKAIELPGTVCCWNGAGESVIFRKNSRLLVLAGLINETGQYGAHFYELKNDRFVHIKTIPVKEEESGATSPASMPPPLTTTYSPPLTQPQEPSLPNEDKPPVGRDLVLSMAQIRYCVAEVVRMDGAKSAMNNHVDSDVDRFNAMVADYNSRCGSFRYRSGALESARRDVEPYRSQFQSEGRNRFARPSTSSLSEPAPSRPAPDATVQAIQRKLNELGYEAGTSDGLMGRGTRSAILAFQRDMGLTQNGQPDGALLAILNSATSITASSTTARPNRDSVPERSTALPPRSVPDPLPPQQVQAAPASRDAKNFGVCVSGQYPSLCNYALLTPDEKVQVAVAERRVNFQTCASGNYPSLCKRSLLTPEEATQVAAAERRVNLQTCISGNYPSLCKRNLLTQEEAAQVAAAERRVNFQTCVSGNYPSLCKHSLLTSDEAVQVAAAERRVNFQTCISGQYPSLCKHSLLTSDEAARVADAERRAGNR